MVVTVTYEELDRIFYERIRLALVESGLLPDITLYSDITAWQAARATLRTSLLLDRKVMVDVLGVGSWDDKGEKADARIVIMRGSRTPGSIGGSPSTFMESYIDAGGNRKFRKYKAPDSSDNLAYEIRTSTNDTETDKVMSRLMDKAFGRRRYLPTIDEQGKPTLKDVLVISTGTFDFTEQRYIERAFRYLIEDVFLQEPELIQDNIPVLTSLSIGVSLQDGSEVSNDLDLSVDDNARITEDNLLRETEDGTLLNVD